MKPDNHKPQDEKKNNQNISADDVDEAGDFLGHEHGNAMPENETSTDKILNLEDNGFQKNQPGKKNSDDETQSIH